MSNLPRTNIYILRLTEKRYYIGKSNDPNARIAQHFAGKGSMWTTLYLPISVVAIHKNRSPFDEDRFVKEYMHRYGIDFVRGGSYSNLYLTTEQKYFLNQELLSVTGRCYNCGLEGHYSNKCPGLGYTVLGNDWNFEEII